MRFLYRILSLYPPFLGAGIRVQADPRDPYTMTVRMPLRWFNRNAFGTHFGGSLYAMCDPFFVLILHDALGEGYVVWDKSACIDFIRPGRGVVCATFHISPAEVEEIRMRADAGETVEPTFQASVIDASGEVVARVDKVLHVRQKKPRS